MATKFDGISDVELEREVQRRANVRRQKQAEADKAKRAEEKRIYDLPESVAARKEDSFNRVVNGYSHKNIALDEYGVWSIYGEDPNCDMGGSHHSPYLGKVEGTFEQAVRHAIDLPGFWQWGAGGEIRKAKKETVKKL